MIIGVFSFLEFGTDGATTMPTRDQTLKRPGMFLPPGQVTPFLCSHFLCPMEQISRDQRFVDPFVALAVPVEFAKINRIVQNLVDRRLRDSCAAPAKTEAFGEGAFSDFGQRVFASAVPFEYFPNEVTSLAA